MFLQEAVFLPLFRFVTLESTSAEELARCSLRDGANVVIAVGGDGTVNDVVNGFFTEDKAEMLVRFAS